MNLTPGSVLLDAKHYREHARIRELLIERVNGDNVHVETLSGQRCAKVVSARYFEHSDDWTAQGYWATDTSARIPAIRDASGYEVRRLGFNKTVLKLVNSAAVTLSLVPSLAPSDWTARDDQFKVRHGSGDSPGDLAHTVRFLDFTYNGHGGLQRLVYRRSGQQWLLVRTLITPAPIEFPRKNAPR